MPIVNTDAPITSARTESLIQQLTEIYPAIRQETIGRTAFGRPISAMVIGSGPRKVLYTAAHHANEWITAYILLKFAEDLAAEQKARVTYDNILRLSDDPDVNDVIKFLREREIVHFQRFGEAVQLLREKLNQKNVYAMNPAIDM